ncbi:MAG: hypothetical protein A2033_11700 [Bacteroidetes bacterium GWA2_31_9]|nr:MAG: hypothetical protein A2033_11700 [Bacteroidetes bacterium GWA2_31_9]
MKLTNKYIIAILISITFITFFPSLKNDFVNWDDDIYVLQNPDIREISSASVSNMFSSEYVGLYLPLTIFSYAINYSIGELNPFGYHLLNLILHIFSTIILYLLIKKLSSNISIAFFVALLFAIHPLRVESVVWISQRKDVLYVFFYLLSLLSFTNYLFSKTNNLKWYFASLIFFIISLFSKTSAVTLPLIILALAYYIDKSSIKKVFVKLIPYFLISLIFGIITYSVLKTGGNIYKFEENYSLLDQICLGTYSFIFYIYKLVFPFDLSPTYYFPLKSNGWLPIPYYISVLVLIILIYLVYKFRKNKIIITGSLIYLFGIFFFLQVIASGRVVTADRYAYIAHIGLLFIIGSLLYTLFRKNSKIFIYFTLVIGIIFSILTSRYSMIWKTGESLFTHSILKNENKSLGYINRGLAHYYGFTEKNKIDYNKAYQDFDKAISINKNDAEGWFNRGNCFMNFQKINEAENDFDKTISLDSLHYKAWNNRGLVYAYKGNFDMAMKYYNHSIYLKNTFSDAYSNIAFVYLNNGNNKMACEYFEKSLKLGSKTAGHYLEQYCKK